MRATKTKIFLNFDLANCQPISGQDTTTYYFILNTFFRLLQKNLPLNKYYPQGIMFFYIITYI